MSTDSSNSPTRADDLPEDGLAEELEAIDDAVAGDGKTPSEPDHSQLDRGLEMLGLIDRVRKHAAARPVDPSEFGATHEPTLISGTGTRSADDGDSSAFAVTQIGEYEILDEIARGGMGVVFRARHRSLERIVALKMMLAGPFAQGEEKQRFRVEAEAAAQLDHPGIVPVYDVGEHRGLPYFTMSYVEGEDLQSRIQRDPLEPRVAAELTRQIAEAVASAHDQEVIHRDIKPANVLIDRENRTRITDFGLARRTNSASDLTGTGQVLGTPGYMPPEQAAGRPDCDGRLADVYAIGATFYCMLTGQPPFRAAGAVDTLRLVIEREPVSPRDLIPTIPSDVATICLKCLHKDPQRRYQSAAELSADLKRFLNGEPILARPVSRAERVMKWARRHPLVAGLSVLLTVALLALMAGGAWYQNRLSESQANTVDQLYRTLTSEAEFLNELRPVGYGPRVRDLIRQARDLETPAVDPDQLRQLTVRSLGHAVARDPITISGFNTIVTAANITEDGRFLLAGLETGELAVIDLTDHKEVQRIPAHSELISRIEIQGDDAIRLETPFCRQWSVWTRENNGEWTRKSPMESLPTSDFLGMVLTPDGQTVVGFTGLPQESSERAEWRRQTPGDVVTASNLHVPIRYNADSIRFAIMPSGATEAVEVPNVPVSLRFDVNNSHLAVVHSWVDVSEYHNTLSIIDLADPAEVRTLQHDCGALFNVALSRDGRFVACSGHRGAEVFDGVSGTSLVHLDRLGRCSVESFTGDAGDILLRTESEYIWYSTRMHETLARFPVPDDGAWLHICPSGRHALWLGTRDVQVLDLTNRERRQIAAHRGIAKGVNFSPDGRLLLSSGGDGATRVWDVEHATELYSFSGSLSRFSPDGRLIVSWNGTLQFWDAATGALLAEAHCGFFPNTIRFDPRGGRVAAASVKSGDLGVWEFTRNPDGILGAERVFHDPDGLATVAFSPSGRRIAYRVGPDVRVHDFDNPESDATVAPGSKPVLEGLLYLDERRLAVAVDTLEVWNVETGQLEAASTEKIKPPLTTSPDDRFVLCRRKILDAEDLSLEMELPGWSEDCWGVDWSPGGRHVALALDPGDVVVWDMEAVGGQLAALDLAWDGIRIQEVDPVDAIQAMELLCQTDYGIDDPQLWMERCEALIGAVNPDRELGPTIREEVNWLTDHLSDVNSRPFVISTEPGTGLLDRFDGVYRLSVRLDQSREYAAEQQLLQSAQRLYESLDQPDPRLTRKAARIYHASGDLHNFRLPDEQTCLDAYRAEEQLLAALPADSAGAWSELDLARSLFWLNRNSGLALDRWGRRDDAIERIDRALSIYEEDPDISVETDQVSRSYELLIQWLRENERNTDAEAVRERARTVGIEID